MKIANWIVWALIIIAALLIVLSVVGFLFNFSICSINLISFFNAASTLLLLAIAIHLVTRKCCEDKKQ